MLYSKLNESDLRAALLNMERNSAICEIDYYERAIKTVSDCLAVAGSEGVDLGDELSDLISDLQRGLAKARRNAKRLYKLTLTPERTLDANA